LLHHYDLSPPKNPQLDSFTMPNAQSTLQQDLVNLGLQDRTLVDCIPPSLLTAQSNTNADFETAADMEDNPHLHPAFAHLQHSPAAKAAAPPAASITMADRIDMAAHAPSFVTPGALKASASTTGSVSSAGRKRGPYAKRPTQPKNYECARCGTRESPVWRCKRSGTIMCNACRSLSCGCFILESADDVDTPC
jgi:hypothetical protein